MCINGQRESKNIAHIAIVIILGVEKSTTLFNQRFITCVVTPQIAQNIASQNTIAAENCRQEN